MLEQEIEISTVPRVAAGRARGGRAIQQDDLVGLHAAEENAHLLVLADGMGGDGAGELASAGVVAVARKLWASGSWREQPGPIFLETLCQEAHAELRRRRDRIADGALHSTVVALLLRGDRACWVHVGDSRLYRFQHGRCLGMTEDHSLVQQRVRLGELSDAQAVGDPDQYKLLRGLGGPQPPEVEHGCAMLRSGQAFALCSDGLWAHLSTEELARLAQRPDQAAALREGIAMALERGGAAGDNVALMLVRAGQVGGWRQRGGRLWSAMFGAAG